MKLYNKIIVLTVIAALFYACETDEDVTYNFDYIGAPGNVSAVYDITQDNTGTVTILPNAEGAQRFEVSFGDTENETPQEYKPGEIISHIFSEGVYTIGITAIGITGLKTDYEQPITVTFKAPENMVVSIEKNTQNPRIVTVKANADFVTVFDVFFGDTIDEEPMHILPDETVTHTYAEPGDYIIKVIAKSGGAATTEFTDTVNIPAASDPVNLPVNFESFTVNYAFENFGNAFTEVVDNPDANDMNTSDRVAKMVKAAGAETWAGSFLTLENPIDFSTNTSFKVKVWSPKAGATVKLKVENLSDGNIGYEVDALTTSSNEWEELTYDFSAIDQTNDYQKVVIFFDFGNAGDGATYYFDDIKLVPALIPTSFMVQDFEGTAPEFTDFGNIAPLEVITNPDPTGANNSGNVVKLVKTAGAETWAGGFFKTATPLDFENFSKIRVKTWSPKSGIVVKVKLENADASITHEVDVTNTTSNAWEELVYDFSEAPAADYVTLVVFFDFGNPGDDAIYYYDQIELINDEGGSNDLAIQNFEGEAPEFTDFGNIAAIEVVDNPDATGINTTAKVAKFVKTSGAETWAGGFFKTNTALDFDNFSKIKVKTWSPKSGIVIKVKLENADASITHEVDVTNTVSNAWEELVYDFSAAPAADYTTVVIFFDFDTAGDDAVYYFDEFALTN